MNGMVQVDFAKRYSLGGFFFFSSLLTGHNVRLHSVQSKI